MKTLLKVFGVLVVIIAIGVWFLASNIDDIAKQVIENVGTETLATEVSLDGVKIKLGSESGAALSGLTIANPSGWSSPYAFELGTIGASIAPASLSKEVIEIPRILVEDAHMTFEQKGTKTNLQDILSKLDSGEGTAADEPPAEGADVLIAISELRLVGIGVTAISDQLDEPVTFVLDDIVVRDIGLPTAGATPAEAAKLIIGPVTNTVLKQAKDQVAKVVEQKVRAELEKKKDEATEGLKKTIMDKLGR
ncbi:hypothetical protein R0135_06170 [Congregibacter variabilis]|uniref:AsmA domain-containing protein n=1 Tax=Congregibacter variabilis TaxID=3081200 RepID=A0ABZ0I7M1_9GAMM|nr:hypothetical protein R0135_06170 [Congregibacter sp. IMCC43200]